MGDLICYIKSPKQLLILENMINRMLETCIRDAARRYRALTLIGPRQSGKTFLSRHILFPDYHYVSLENPDTRMRASADPRGFLAGLSYNTILDEVQKLPELLSYLQEILDDREDSRKFILTGSDSLLISEKISQSLAGRTRIFKVLPLAFGELTSAHAGSHVNDVVLKGFYPRLFDQEIYPEEWYADYYQTYVEKDVRQMQQIDNLLAFDRLVRVAAGLIGQLVNASSMSTEVGVSQPTITRWLGVLEASFILFMLKPHFKNFAKRLTKTPKIYFFDVGLLCWLLGIRTASHLATHPLRGQIFENLIVAEVYKRFVNVGREPPLYFWRDQHGHEIDLIIDRGDHLECIEIKSGQTFAPDFVANLSWMADLQGHSGGKLIYGGGENFAFKDFQVESWRSFTISAR